MSEGNIATFRAIVDAANRVDEEGILRLCDENIEFIPARSAVQGGYHGHDGMRAFLADNDESFEVFEIHPSELRDLDDRVLVFGTIHIRGRGGGVETDIATAGIATFRDGKMIRWEDFRERDLALAAAGLEA